MIRARRTIGCSGAVLVYTVYVSTVLDNECSYQSRLPKLRRDIQNAVSMFIHKLVPPWARFLDILLDYFLLTPGRRVNDVCGYHRIWLHDRWRWGCLFWDTPLSHSTCQVRSSLVGHSLTVRLANVTTQPVAFAVAIAAWMGLHIHIHIVRIPVVAVSL